MTRARLARRAGQATLLFALFVFLFPIAWIFSTAWKPGRDIFAIPPALWFEPTTRNFETLFQIFDVPQLVINTLIISLGTAVLALALGVPAGYALARLGTRWAHGIAYFFLAIRMIPPVAILIPFYLMMRDVGLLGTYWALIILDAMQSACFVVWMMYGYFRTVPKEIEEAAVVDGCTQWGTFWRVVLPTVVPGIIASALFCIIFAWNNFIFPAFLTNAQTRPLSVALISAYGSLEINWGTLGALMHFSVLPIVALALVLNRYFVQGLTRGVH
jgi:multiple sugar transport system permease protein